MQFRKFRRLLQFRLSFFLLFTTAICICFAKIALIKRAYDKQHASVSVLGKKIKHIATDEPKQKWLKYFVGEAHFYDVVHLSFQGVSNFPLGDGVGDNDMVHLANFPKLRRLSLQSTDVTDDGLLYLSRLSQLDTLSLEQADISGNGLIHLQDLTNLKHLNVEYCDCADRFHYLKKLAQLRVLIASNVSEADVLHIAKLPRLEEFNFWMGTDLELANCRNLRRIRVLYHNEDSKLRLKNLPRLSRIVGPRKPPTSAIQSTNVPLLVE